ncbi:hypothetical protein MTO96_002668 [Rhipicephalus appendiculatus]
MYHRIVEALKFAYAKRTYLGDEAFVNTTDIVALMLSRDYANSLRSKISDIETHEPSFYEPATHMNEDKGTAHVNVLAPNGDAVSATSTVNRYFGAMLVSPSTGIVLNSGMDDFSTPLVLCTLSLVELAVLVSPVALLRFCSGHFTWMKQSNRPIDDLRIHHQLYPNHIFYEKAFPPIILDKLQEFGHKVRPEVEESAFQGITRSEDGGLLANVDFRKGGSIAGY